MNKSRKPRLTSKTKFSPIGLFVTLVGLFVMSVGLLILVLVIDNKQDLRSNAAPSAELQTDRTNQTFTGAGYTSEYHIYAAGLDWTKSVGLLMYTDGSGESGLKTPTSSYLMAGSMGMIAIAKKHNMVLVTPFSPNKACSDGDGSCWYDGDSPGYAKWAEALITSIESQYSIDKKRVAVGGYSSGATFTNGWWVPSGAAQRTMDAGVIVAISYGGPNYMPEVAYTPAFKSAVHMHWNGGDADPSITDVRKGYDHYTKAGFQTTIEILPGVDHDRSEEFGTIMDAQITKYISPATAIGSSGAVPPTVSTPVPTYFCGGSSNCVPTGMPTQPQTGTTPVVTPVPSVVTISNVPLKDPANIGPAKPINSPNPAQPAATGGKNQNFIVALIALILQFFASILELFS